MCISAEESARAQAKHARPCWRVELDARNLDAWQLLGWPMHENLRSLAGEYFRAKLHGCPADERARVLERVAHFFRDSRVMAILYPSLQED